MGACMGAQGCGWVRTVFVPWWWFSDNISSSSCAGVKGGHLQPCGAAVCGNPWALLLARGWSNGQLPGAYY